MEKDESKYELDVWQEVHALRSEVERLQVVVNSLNAENAKLINLLRIERESLARALGAK